MASEQKKGLLGCCQYSLQNNCDHHTYHSISMDYDSVSSVESLPSRKRTSPTPATSPRDDNTPTPANNANTPPPPKKKRRINYSISPHLELMTWAVHTFDACRNDKRATIVPPSLKEFWIKYLMMKGISLSSFRKYACVDVSKRRILGSQVGPSPPEEKRRLLDERRARAIANQERSAMINHYDWINNHHETTPVAWQQVDHQRQVSREQESYQRMRIHYNESPPKTAKEKWRMRQCLEEKLPWMCSMIGGDGDFLSVELDLMKRCHDTFGSAEVPYCPPDLDGERGEKGKAKTDRRRNEMNRGIERFQLVQTRHTLALLHGGTSRPKLLATLDLLLKFYDEDLMSRNLEPTDLRQRLREHEEKARRRMGKPFFSAKRLRAMGLYPDGTTVPKAVPGLVNLNIPDDDYTVLVRQTREEIAKVERSMNETPASEGSVPSTEY